MSTTSKKNYYQIFEISPNASPDEIKNQYRFLVQAWHPDKFGSPESKARAEEKLKQINEAYAVLNDPKKRKEYDREGQYSHDSKDAGESRGKTHQGEQAKPDRREQTERDKERQRRQARNVSMI